MSASQSKSTKELLASAKLPERSVSICLRGDLVADIAELERELEALVKDAAANRRMSSKSGQKALADQIEAKRAEMAEHTLTMRLRAMTSAKWRELVRKYPPAKDDKTGLGVDLMRFMGEAIPASVVEPTDMDDEDWQTFNENVPPAEVTRLMSAVWEMNTQGVDIPKSLIASVVNQRSAADSK